MTPRLKKAAPRAAASVPDDPTRAIGVDIGGTKIALGAVDGSGHVLGRVSMATEAGLGFDRAVGRIGEAIDGLLDKTGWDPGTLSGIGIACAGPVDPVRGLVNNPFTLEGWDGCDIVSPLRSRFGIHVVLENDADAALIGECWVGAGRGCDPVVMLTFGTGVGGAAMIGGRILRGAGGEHPEMGHIVAAGDGPGCYCGAHGCLESLASGSAIAAGGAAGGLTSASEVFEAAERGNLDAAGTIERALDAAGTAAWTLYHAFLPERLILGGGLMDGHFEAYAGAMNRRLGAATQFSHSTFSITRAALANNAGIIGAARLCHPTDTAKRETP
jgi:glucokinase